jgi:hypothetical protein
MYRLAYFVLGFLAYGLLELITVAIVCRYFPRYIGRLQRIGDSLYRAFRQDPYADDEPDQEYTEEEEDCNCPLCSGDYDYYPGQAVVYQDSSLDGYGRSLTTWALKGTILELPTGDVYPVDDGDKHTHFITGDHIAPYPSGGIIPEGTPVTFIPSSGPAIRDGITYRARVFQKKLRYIVEYGEDGDVLQECVSARNVTRKVAGHTGTVGETGTAGSTGTAEPKE